MKKTGSVLLFSYPSVLIFLLEPLHVCRDGVEGGGAEGRGCFDCDLGRRVILGPLEITSWLCALDICIR